MCTRRLQQHAMTALLEYSGSLFTHVKGCQFHLGQAMWRKIQELGLNVIVAQ